MIDDVPIHRLGNAVDFHRIRLINCIEQRRKGIAQVEATTATMADVENSLQLLKKRFLGVEFFRLPIECMPCRRLEATLASSAGQWTCRLVVERV